MLWKRPPVEDYPPYRMLAKVYDYVMRHVDYGEWADYVEKMFRFFGPVPRRIVEVACGTGTLAIELSQRGYLVRGIDASEAMIIEARAKAEPLGPHAPVFAVGDMRRLAPDEADAVLCLYDSVNYCLTEDDLRATLASFRRVVRDGALGIFDITTEANSLRYFTDYRYRERCEEYVYKRHSRYIAEERLQLNEFLFERKDSSEVIRELHEQRIYPLAEVLSAIDAEEWTVLGAFDDYTMDPADEQAERVHVIMRAV